MHDKDTSEATKNDVNLDDSFENMEILEKVADSVPEKVLNYWTLNTTSEWNIDIIDKDKIMIHIK